MSIWNKIVIGAKFLFCGFESATSYLLELLNELLSKEDVTARVQEIRKFVVTALEYLRKYEKYCPAIWANDYTELLAVLQKFVDVLADNKVTPKEAEETIAAVKAAIEEWMK